MNHDTTTQGWGNREDSHSRSYSRTSNFRSSPQRSVPHNVNIVSPRMDHSLPSSRSVSPGSVQGPRAPCQQPRTDPSQEDSANARWRSWRAPEEVDQSLPSAVSPTVQNRTKPGLYQETSTPEGDHKPGTLPELEDSDEDENIWNDDIRDPPEYSDNNIVEEEPPFRSGWTPEPQDEDQPIVDPSPSIPLPSPPPTQPKKRVLTLYIANKRKDTQNISIDDICIKFGSKKLMQDNQSASPHADPPMSHTTENNPLPFFVPKFFGNPSPDHYSQYNNNTGSGNQWSNPTSNSENKRTKRFTNEAMKRSGLADNSNNSNAREVYARHLDQEEIEKQLSEGDLYKGVIKINRRNRNEAYVVPEGLDSDIYIGSPRMRNRAFDGDVVAVRLCDVDTVWKPKDQSATSAAAAAALDFNFFSVEDDEPVELTEIIEKDASAKPKYAGEVVGILDCPKERTIVGVLGIDQSSNVHDLNGLYKNKKMPTRFYFRPLDKSYPLIDIADRDPLASLFTSPDGYKTTLLVAQVLNWDITRRRPYGKIIKVLGEVGDMAAETEAILAYCGVSSSPYSPSALKCVPNTPWTIPAEEISKRRDYRAKRCFSIDPASARDLDDVLHIERLRDGTFEVGVHIADVSYFIKPNTPLDAEAHERGTSIYLVDRVLHMLPTALCENLCSLNPGQDKLAFSVVWKLDDEANILNTWFGKTVIASSAKLTYEDAQRVIDGGHLSAAVCKAADGIERDIHDLMKLSHHLRKRRFAKGALALQSVKLSIDLDDNGEPIKISKYQTKLANDLIEEYMLLANISVAKKISSTYPNQAMLRRHPGPIPRRLDQFVQVAKALGYEVDKSSAGSLQTTLSSIPESPMKEALFVLATKPMQRAKYFCSGSLDVTQFIHYALNESVYTHFTSPIRRYADIIVHRQLHNALELKAESGFSRKTVESSAYICNYRAGKAKTAEDQSSWLYLARFLSRTKDINTRRAMVLRVEPDFLDVYLNEFGLERRLYIEDFPLEGSRFNVEDESLHLYWERGVPVNLDMLIRQEFRHSNKARRQAVPDVSDEFLQKVKAFSFLDVKLEVDNHGSPPRIVMYPVNPFE